MDLACPGPWWSVDDFSTCFSQRYLHILFPSILIGISALALLASVVVDWNQKRKASRHQRGYRRIPHVDSDSGRPLTPYSDSAEDEPSPTSSSSESSQILILNSKNESDCIRVVASKPKCFYLTTGLEAFSLISQIGIAISLIILRQPSHSDRGVGSHLPYQYLGFITAAITWTYFAAILVLRLLLSPENDLSLLAWYNSINCYGVLWILSAIQLRSAIIHPPDDLIRTLSIASAVLSTLLFGTLFFQRRGNRTVYVEYEGKLMPSKEQTASVYSAFAFSWIHDIVITGYKRPLEISDVWNLIPTDKAHTVVEEYRQVKKTWRLAYHLLSYFKWSVLAQALWAALHGFLLFMPTLLLQALVRYIEKPNVYPYNVAWLYIFLVLLLGIVNLVADGQALWFGRRICIKLRAIVIAEIYAKALRRRAAIGTSPSTFGSDPAALLDALTKAANSEAEKPRTIWERLFPCFFPRRRIMLPDPEAHDDPSDNQDSGEGKKEAKKDETASSGAIINLMSVDSIKVSDICAYLHLIWASTPVQIITAVALLYRVLGLSSIVGVILMVIILPMNMLIANRFSELQKLILKATDARIHTTNEVLGNIRIIKYFAWEDRYINEIEEKRTTELMHLRKRYWWWSLSAAIWSGSPILITLCSFYFYTVVEGKPLIPSVAFTAVSLFQILRIPLDQLAGMIAHVQESKVSLDRVDEFLNQPETDKYNQLRDEAFDSEGRPLIGFKDANFTWALDNEAGRNPDDPSSSEDTSAFRLFDMNFLFEQGGINVVVGPTGCGKSSLLMALLGEMTKLSGNVYLPGGGRPREEIRPDPSTGLADTVAYCAQQPWLINDTIEQNILFAQPLDPKLYDAVVTACSLTRDFEILKDGDQTLVGEKGVTLSGGQKQRIALARALYSSSRVVILDDILSAVDLHTAKWIFENAILGPLMYKRTCILVTHNAALCLPHADFGIVMDNGRIVAQGDLDTLRASGKLPDDITKSNPASRASSRLPSRVPSNVGGEEASGEVVHHRGLRKPSSEDKHVETKQIGSVKLSVILFYLRSMGGPAFWLIAGLGLVLQHGLGVGLNAWIREFANAYTREGGDSHSVSGVSHSRSLTSLFSLTQSDPVFGLAAKFPAFTMQPATVEYALESEPPSAVNPYWYLAVYGLMGFLYMALTMFRDYFTFGGSLAASRLIHRKLTETIARAKFIFFDGTPFGQIMNRFSKDIETVDQEVTSIALGVISCIAGLITIVGLISVIIPAFLFAAVIISLLYLLVGMLYINSSRDLRRLESVQRSPLFQHFGETLSGIMTIRAYGEERRFIRANLAKIDVYNRAYFYYLAVNRWLSIRVDSLGAFVAFTTAAFILTNTGRIDPGAAGLAMTYALTFTEHILWFVRLYGSNEQNMNSVERVQEYLEVPQEAPPTNEKNKPADNWPSQGVVEFVNYSTRYRPDLDLVLKNVSVKFEAGEKVGIVGRTGAGKSSLALALFRALEAEEGKILVDSLDIGTIGLKDLRGRIVMVPQDPTLFTGTIRSNLDPFGQIEDDDVIFQALVDVQLIDAIPGKQTSGGSEGALSDDTAVGPVVSGENDGNNQAENQNIFLDLDSHVAESGQNLSQGQRQLLCLARALLRKPKILLMDEATASIDYSTDSKIQGTIRRVKNTTTITIAHRLQTIIDYDKIVVLDHGQVAECGHPWELLQTDARREGGGENGERKGGIFRLMCESSGEMEVLMAEAKKAWEKR